MTLSVYIVFEGDECDSLFGGVFQAMIYLITEQSKVLSL